MFLRRQVFPGVGVLEAGPTGKACVQRWKTGLGTDADHNEEKAWNIKGVRLDKTETEDHFEDTRHEKQSNDQLWLVSRVRTHRSVVHLTSRSVV